MQKLSLNKLLLVYNSEQACFAIHTVKINVIYGNIIDTKCEINRLIDCLFWDA